MPTATITNWSNGPMGPGFFIHFPAHVDIWYDGGGFWDLVGRNTRDDDEHKRMGEYVALIMLMRGQCQDF